MDSISAYGGYSLCIIGACKGQAIDCSLYSLRYPSLWSSIDVLSAISTRDQSTDIDEGRHHINERLRPDGNMVQRSWDITAASKRSRTCLGVECLKRIQGI